MNQKKEISILLADDHPFFVDGVAQALDSQDGMRVLERAKDGEEVMKILPLSPCDVLITDLEMPKLSGEELIKKVQKDFPNIKLIVLSMKNDGRTISRLIKEGLHSYLYKDSDLSVLLKAISAVVNGGRYFPREIKESIFNDLIDQNPYNPEELSEREKEVLKLIAQEYTQNEIAEKLFISPHTVVSHKRKLILKLGVKNVAGLVRKAVEMGVSE